MIRKVIKSRFIKVTFIILFVILAIAYTHQRLAENMNYPDIAIEVEGEFLSEEYFTELESQYEQIREDYDKWYIVDFSNGIASHAILTWMMEDFREQRELLEGHPNDEQFFETFDQHVRKLPKITKEIHYFRNELNPFGGAPERLEDMIQLAACEKWRLFSARYHRYEEPGLDAAYNVKFISSDGRFEAVYNIETGQIITSPVNMGTYNYAPGSILFWKYYKHHKFDKTPWRKWGNTPEVAYEEIIERATRHGSKEQKNSAKELENLINRMAESQECP